MVVSKRRRPLESGVDVGRMHATLLSTYERRYQNRFRSHFCPQPQHALEVHTPLRVRPRSQQGATRRRLEGTPVRSARRRRKRRVAKCLRNQTPSRRRTYGLRRPGTCIGAAAFQRRNCERPFSAPGNAGGSVPLCASLPHRRCKARIPPGEPQGRPWRDRRHPH
jgi:hypothetical protein